MRVFVCFIILLLSNQAWAQTGRAAAGTVDLILPPALASADAPFYRGASVKMGNQMVPVIEGDLPSGQLAQYQPDRKAVVVSDDATISENRKGQALMDVVSALQAASVETAAGKEKK